LKKNPNRPTKKGPGRKTLVQGGKSRAGRDGGTTSERGFDRNVGGRRQRGAGGRYRRVRPTQGGKGTKGHDADFEEKGVPYRSSKRKNSWTETKKRAPKVTQNIGPFSMYRNRSTDKNKDGKWVRQSRNQTGNGEWTRRIPAREKFSTKGRFGPGEAGD